MTDSPRKPKRDDHVWPKYLPGGRMRTSTVALAVAFVALFWIYQNYEPPPTTPAPATQVVPPGFVPDPSYTWVPRTEVRRTTTPTTTTTTPTTTETTSPTESTGPSSSETSPTSPTSPTSTTPASPGSAPSPGAPTPTMPPVPSPVPGQGPVSTPAAPTL